MWILDELEKHKNDETIAIKHRGEEISFAELWKKSEILAKWLQKHTKTKVPVLIYGNKDTEIVIVMLAALKMGKAYVPLDITFPMKRVEEIGEETQAEVCFNFTESPLKNNKRIRTVFKDELKKIISSIEDGIIDRKCYVQAEDDCYILFTSGSTGRPKGVPISKKNILNFVTWFKQMCTLPSDKQVVLNQVSYSFDVSVIPLYIYLPMGKTLFSIDKMMMDNLKELFCFLEKSDIAVWVSTPAFLEICSFDDKFNERMLDKLEKVILAGEVLAKKLVENMEKKFSNLQIINGYGPTEGTVLLSACQITPEMMQAEENLPIGKILPDGRYIIIDEKNNEVSENETGELVVVSNSISKGYFNNPEQSSRVFFEAENGKMGYHTGDLVYEKNDMLYYVARKDTQIKLNGFRIELTDISNNLNNIDLVSNSIVLPVYREGHVSYLVGIVTLKEKSELSSLKQGIEIKKKLRKLIPSYMVPRKIVIIEKFPMNTNGKIDRKKLMEEYI